MAPKKPEIIIEHIDPRELVPYEGNAKIHGDTQIARLVQQFKAHGFDVPIVVDENRVILKGHARRAAALKAGMKTVPAIVRTGLTEAQKRAIRIADNRLGESDYDISILRAEIKDILGADLSADLLGFSPGEIDVLLGAGDKVLGVKTGKPGAEEDREPSGDGEMPRGKAAPREATCPECGHRFGI